MRERVSELAEAASAVEIAAMHYWLQCSTKEAPTAALSLTSAIARLSRRAIVLQKAGLNFDQPFLISEIRKAATGGEFATKGRRQKATDADHVTETAGCLEDLLVAVDAAFYTEFHPVRPATWWRLVVLGGVVLLLSHG